MHHHYRETLHQTNLKMEWKGGWKMEWKGGWKIGDLEIGQEFDPIKFPEYTKLHQYDYEDFFVYSLSDGSTKIFVLEEKIKAIQNGKNFIYKGFNLIAEPTEFVVKMLEENFEEIDNYEKYGTLHNSKLGLTLYWVNDFVSYITISNWI